jgi:hypothetical protein
VLDALAARFGGRRATSRPIASCPARTLLEVALENAVEGCVRETYGAALGVLRAARATCPEIRAAMATLARDECGHAELSWRVLAWHLRALDEAGRLALARAMSDARHALSDEIARESPMSDAEEALLGTPKVEEKLRLLATLEERVCFQAA